MSKQAKIQDILKLKNLLITAVIFMLPMFNYAEYQGKDALRAANILSQTIEGRPYYPVLKVPGHNNKQGKKNVYLNEYGVCVLVKNQALNDLLQEANKIAYPNKAVRPEITPHITIIQVVFRTDSLEKLINAIKEDVTQKSIDGTVKTRFQLHDGHFMESVLIPSLQAALLGEAPAASSSSSSAALLTDILNSKTPRSSIGFMV